MSAVRRRPAKGRRNARERILKAAWERLLRGEPSTLEAITSDAGVSRQAAYLHFGSRAGLLLALVDYIDDNHGLKERVAEISAIEDPAERLEAMLRFSAEYETKIHGLAMAVARQAQEDPDLHEAFEDRMARRRSHLRRLVEPFAEEGRLPSGWTLDEAVDFLWELGAPSSYHHLVVERGWTPERFGDRLVWAARALIA